MGVEDCAKPFLPGWGGVTGVWGDGRHGTFP